MKYNQPLRKWESKLSLIQSQNLQSNYSLIEMCQTFPTQQRVDIYNSSYCQHVAKLGNN